MEQAEERLEEINEWIREIDEDVDGGSCCHDCASGGDYYNWVREREDIFSLYPELMGK
jgi:hypothetical protein